MLTSCSSSFLLSLSPDLVFLSVFGVLEVLMTIFGEGEEDEVEDVSLLLLTLVILVSLLVLDNVLEFDLKLPSQLSLEMETDLCLCFFDIGGLGG